MSTMQKGSCCFGDTNGLQEQSSYCVNRVESMLLANRQQLYVVKIDLFRRLSLASIMFQSQPPMTSVHAIRDFGILNRHDFNF